MAKGGVTDQELPERMRSAPFSMFNAVPTANEVSFDPTPSDLPAAWKARPGQPHTVFTNTVRIQRRQGGDWVRAYMTRHPEKVHKSPAHPLDRDRDFVAWSAAFTMEQLECWTASCRADMEAFARVGEAHRPRTRTLIIPEDAHRGAGSIIHDLRPFLEAEAAGADTSSVPIPPVAADTRIAARLDTQRLDARMHRAGIRDQYGRQQLLHTGLFNHSTASKDTVLMPNYPPVARHAHRAAEQAKAEAADGILSEPYRLPPFLPCRIHPYSAVEHGSKVRFCCDMSAPQGYRDGAGLNSINAGVPFSDTDLVGKMRLTSTRAFAADVGILQAGADPAGPLRVWTASCDWSRFYRQLPTAVRQLWAHLLWLQPGGPQIDHATCFGDAAAPAQANRVQVRLSSRLISSCGAFAALTCSSEPTG